MREHRPTICASMSVLHSRRSCVTKPACLKGDWLRTRDLLPPL